MRLHLTLQTPSYLAFYFTISLYLLFSLFVLMLSSVVWPAKLIFLLILSATVALHVRPFFSFKAQGDQKKLKLYNTQTPELKQISRQDWLYASHSGTSPVPVVLMSVQHLGPVISLTFKGRIHQKYRFKTHIQVIWQDQVSYDDWRRLVVLERFF